MLLANTVSPLVTASISLPKIECVPLVLRVEGGPAALERKDPAQQNQQKVACQTREGAIGNSRFRHPFVVGISPIGPSAVPL